jgi:hypothetical protein
VSGGHVSDISDNTTTTTTKTTTTTTTTTTAPVVIGRKKRQLPFFEPKSNPPPVNVDFEAASVFLMMYMELEEEDRIAIGHRLAIILVVSIFKKLASDISRSILNTNLNINVSRKNRQTLIL